MKRRLSIILVIALLMSTFSAPAFAALPETDEPTSSNYFISYGTTTSQQGNGKLLISFTAVGMGICDVLGVASFYIQEWDEDDEHWWDVTGTLSGETGTNVGSYSFSRYFFGVPGKKYRVQVIFFCQKGTGSEHKNYTSPSIIA